MTGRNQLHAYRLQMEVTQANMAQSMGIPLRTYEDLEGGRTAIRDVHLNAAAFACIKIMGIVGYDVLKLPHQVRDVLAEAGLA